MDTNFTNKKDFITLALTIDNKKAYAYTVGINDEYTRFYDPEDIVDTVFITERCFYEKKYEDYMDWIDTLSEDEFRDYIEEERNWSFLYWLESDIDDFYDCVEYRQIVQDYDLSMEDKESEDNEKESWHIYSIEEAEKICGRSCKIVKSTIVSDSEIPNPEEG